MFEPSNETKHNTIISQFKFRHGYIPNLNCPKTFNEKLQWYKLHYHNPIMTKCADKFSVREYVTKSIGDKYLIPLIGAWKSINEISIDKLPNEFVLKTTHASGQNVICNCKSNLDWSIVKNKFTKWLLPEANHYWLSYEWCYKNIPPQIICEKFIGNDLPDYKLFCFGGKPKLICISSGRQRNKLCCDFYDLNWKKLPFTRYYPVSNIDWSPIVTLNEMIDIAQQLSKPFPFVRIDLYEINNKLKKPIVLFGEMTFYPGNGMEPFYPTEWDQYFGDMLLFNN